MQSQPYTWTKEYLNQIVTEDRHRIITSPILADAFRQVDRKDFIPAKNKKLAYEDKEIEIGFGEKINRPTVLASVLEILNPELGGRYLEIGCGPGYLLSILAQVVGKSGHVIGLDRILSLVNQTRENTKKYNVHNNIEIVFMDGTNGYKDMAPFNGIISSVSYPDIPEILKTQLKLGGKLIYPNTENELVIITKVNKMEMNHEIHQGYIFDVIKPGVE